MSPNSNTEIKTIKQLAQYMKAPEGALYAIAMQLSISAESGEQLLQQQIRDIKSAYENQSKSAPQLSGSSQSQGLAEQTASSVQEDRRPRPILRNVQERYSGAAKAELESRKQVLDDRLENAQVNGFQEGVLEELAGADARLNGILSVRNGLLAKQQEEQQEYDDYLAGIVEGGDFLDRFPQAQESYATMSVAPKSTKAQEALDAIAGIKNWSPT